MYEPVRTSQQWSTKTVFRPSSRRSHCTFDTYSTVVHSRTEMKAQKFHLDDEQSDCADQLKVKKEKNQIILPFLTRWLQRIIWGFNCISFRTAATLLQMDSRGNKRTVHVQPPSTKSSQLECRQPTSGNTPFQHSQHQNNVQKLKVAPKNPSS